MNELLKFILLGFVPLIIFIIISSKLRDKGDKKILELEQERMNKEFIVTQ